MPALDLPVDLLDSIVRRAQAEGIEPRLLLLRALTTMDAGFGEQVHWLGLFIEEIARAVADPDDPPPQGPGRTADYFSYVRDRLNLYLGEHAGMGQVLDRQRALHPEDFPDPTFEESERPRPSVWDRVLSDEA